MRWGRGFEKWIYACRLIACIVCSNCGSLLTSQHQYRHIFRCGYGLLALCTLLLQATASQVDRGGSNVKLHVTESIVEVASNESSFSSSFGNWLASEILVTSVFHSLVAIAFDSYVMAPKRRHDTQCRFSLSDWVQWVWGCLAAFSVPTLIDVIYLQIWKEQLIRTSTSLFFGDNFFIVQGSSHALCKCDVAFHTCVILFYTLAKYGYVLSKLIDLVQAMHGREKTRSLTPVHWL
jgi:hypothetical protein